MKIFLTILAYIGLALVMLGAIPTFQGTTDYLTAPASAWSPGSWHFEWTGMWAILGWVAAGFGTFLALIGGLIARPRYLWIGLIIIGFICALSFGMYFNLPKQNPYQPGYFTAIALNFVSTLPASLVLMLPGEACIIEGLVIHMTKRKAPVV